MPLSVEIESGHLEHCSALHILFQAVKRLNNKIPCGNLNERNWDNERKEIRAIQSRNRIKIEKKRRKEKQLKERKRKIARKKEKIPKKGKRKKIEKKRKKEKNREKGKEKNREKKEKFPFTLPSLFILPFALFS